MKNRLKFILSFLLISMLLPMSVINASSGDTIIVQAPHGATKSTPNPPGTVRVDLGANGGPILINGELLINAPAHSTIIRHPNGSSTVTVGGFTIIAPAGSAISMPSPAGTLRVDFGSGGTVNVNGTNLATASAGVGVVFNTNNTTTAIVGSTSITMPTTNGPTITDNSNGTVTVTLPGQLPITIPASGGNYYAVFFNSNGGGNIAAQIIESGNNIIMPATPSRTGFTFEGWYSNAALTNPWNFGTSTVSSITTLFARWQAAYIPAPPSTSPEPEPTPTPTPETGTGAGSISRPTCEEEVIEELVEETPAEEVIPDEEEPEIDPTDDEPEELQDEEPSAEVEPAEYNADTEANESDETAEDATTIFSSWSDFGNSSPLNDNVAGYRIVSRPTNAQFLQGTLPAFTGGDGLFYAIAFRTNLDNQQRIIAANVPAGLPFAFESPQLHENETITEISIEFDTVPVGFGMGDTITYRFVLLDKDNSSIHWTIEFGSARNTNFMVFSIFDSIDRVSGLQSGHYEVESWTNLQAVISTVQVTLDNPTVTVGEIEAAGATLQQAIDDLAPAPIPSPFTLGNILSTVAGIAVFGLVVFVITKLLKFKKRTALVTVS